MPKHGSIHSVAESLRSFTDLEHLGTGDWACALSRRSTVFHSDLLWVLHFTFFLALHAIGFHIGSPVNRILIAPHLDVHIVCTAADRCSTLLQLFELVASSKG